MEIVSLSTMSNRLFACLQLITVTVFCALECSQKIDTMTTWTSMVNLTFKKQACQTK